MATIRCSNSSPVAFQSSSKHGYGRGLPGGLSRWLSLPSASSSASRQGTHGGLSKWSCKDCYCSRRTKDWRDRFDSRYWIGRSKSSLMALGAVGKKQVQHPPEDFDYRGETEKDTFTVVSSRYPGLLDLVEDGTLLVLKRPDDYCERRTDGFREPETLFLVGTAHTSLVSAASVERIVRAVRPEKVVVELCRSRAGIMYEDTHNVSSLSADPSMKQPRNSNLMSLSGKNFGAAISRTLKLGGSSALGLRLILGGMSQRISKAVGIGTGEEFRAARRAAEEIGSELVLGDRPIEVTLERAWEALPWRERFRLLSIFFQALIFSDLAITEETLQMLKSDDAMSIMFAEIGLKLPSLLQPLVYERDMYLAWSLNRSKAVNGCKRVVGVVGRGHIRGVMYNLRHNQENLRFKDLVKVSASDDKKSRREKFITRALVETALGGILWLAWEHVSSKKCEKLW